MSRIIYGLSIAVASIALIATPALQATPIPLAGVTLETAFVDDPVFPGDPVTLEFALTNDSLVESVTDIGFAVDLSSALPGLEAVGLPVPYVAGLGSMLQGTDFLTLSGGSLAPGTQAVFSATLIVPPTAMPGDYELVTSDVLASGLPIGAPAIATLNVIPEPGSVVLLATTVLPLMLRKRR